MPKKTEARLRIEYMPLPDLLAANRNPKKHDTAGIKHAISTFGFADAPIMDERTRHLVAGHGRAADLLARAQAGEEAPTNIAVDADGVWHVPVQRGWASKTDKEAEDFLLVHNRLVELGAWDNEMLAEILSERAIEDDGLTNTGFTDAFLDDLIAARELAHPLPTGGGPTADAPRQDYTEKFTKDATRVDASRRLLVLDLPTDRFAWLVEGLQEVCRNETVNGQRIETNTAAVMLLVSEYTRTDPPRLTEGINDND